MTVFGRRGRLAVNAAGAVALAACLALLTAAEAAAEPNGASSNPSVSADGRYVAFTSLASNVSLDEDTNGVSDVFVRDRTRGITTRVSISTSGAQADGPSRKPSISDDGRYVAFQSGASNLVAADTNGAVDVFVADVVTGETRRASVTSTGGQIEAVWCTGSTGPYICGTPGVRPSISGDGRYIAFESGGSGVVAGFGGNQVYLYDQTAGKTIEAVSVPYGVSSSGGGDLASVSRDGRYVAFRSSAALVSGDTNSYDDVFVRDRGLKTTTRVSVSSAGAQANSSSASPSISDDGRYVAFSSSASNLITKDPQGVSDSDTNGLWDVFRRDRATGATVRVSGPSASYEPNGTSVRPSVSADGQLVVFDSNVTNQASCRTCDTNRATDVYQFTQGKTTLSRVSVDDRRPEANGPSTEASVSGDGTYAAYATDATTLFAQDTNAVADIGLHTWVSSLPAASASARAEPERSAEACGAGRRRAPGGGERHVHRRVHRHRNGRRHVHRRVHVHRRPAEDREVGAALTSGYCVVSRESEENARWRQVLKQVLRQAAREAAEELAEEVKQQGIEKSIRDCETALYHYTDPGAARDIFSSRRIFPRSGDYVYATEIEPYDRSQSALRAHLGVPDVGEYVVICAEDADPRFSRTKEQMPEAPEDYWWAKSPRDLAGQHVGVTIRPLARGVNTQPE